MAQKATIFKAELDISDMDRHYYASHALTLARHPSETDERMMVRLLAFALNADEQLSFSEGMDNPDDPALWRKDLTGSIEQWIDRPRSTRRQAPAESLRTGRGSPGLLLLDGGSDLVGPGRTEAGEGQESTRLPLSQHPLAPPHGTSASSRPQASRRHPPESSRGDHQQRG